MIRKVIISLTLCISLLLSVGSVYAYNYPSGFWSINTKYENAINSNTHNKIIEYGNRIINLMQTAPDGPEKRNILVTRYNQVGILEMSN